MITRKENLVNEGTCQANSILEINVTLLIAERPCLEEKAHRVKGLEHQWKRPPATHTNEWNDCILPAYGARVAKECLILMASSHGPFIFPLGIRSHLTYLHPHPQHSPAMTGLGGALSTSVFDTTFHKKWMGNILNSMLNFESKSDLKFTSALRHFLRYLQTERLILKWNGLPHLIRARGLNIKSVVVGHLTFH